MNKRLGVLLVGAVVTIFVPVLAPAAIADPVDVTCAGTQTVTYTPGLLLTSTQQTIGVNDIHAPCTSAAVPELTSATSGATVQRVASCLELAEPGNAQMTINWNTGQSSVFAYNRVVSTVGGNTIATLTGTITAGLFAGDTAVSVIVGPTINLLDCLQPPGLTSRTGVITLAIS